MIISRYLFKEVWNALLAITFILLLVFISQQLVRYLNYAASGKIAAGLLLKMIGFEIPSLLAVLLPLGLFLGIMLVYGRLYADNELRVLHACGLSTGRLMWMTTLVAFLVTTVITVLTLWINPDIAAVKQKALTSGSVDNMLGTLMPGRFQVSNEGERVIYVEKISRDHKEAHNLFIAQQEKNKTDVPGTPWVVLSAEKGRQIVDREMKQPFIVADNGYRYEGMPGQNNYQIIQFKRYAIHTPEIASKTQRQIQETVSTKNLFKQDPTPEEASELQWRISIPLSAFLLSLLAVPLCQTRPRQSRYVAFFPAILIYILYMNLLFIGRNLIEQKIISSELGLWWVHAIAFIFVIILSFNWRMRRT